MMPIDEMSSVAALPVKSDDSKSAQLVIGLAPPAWMVAAAGFVLGFAITVWNVVTVSYRQRLIPDDLLGRVNSVYRFFAWGMMPIGALAGGLLVELAEPDWGREAALRLPYLISFLVAGGLAIYGAARLLGQPGWVRLRAGLPGASPAAS